MRTLTLVALLLIPGAAAQGPLGPAFTVDFEGTSGPIKPQAETGLLVAVVAVRCDYVLAGVAAMAPDQPVPIVDLQFQAANGVEVTGPATVAVSPEACTAQPPPTTVTVRQPYQIIIPLTAPGLQALPGNIKIHESRQPPGFPAAPDQSVPFTVTADAYLVSQVTLPSKLERCEDGKARFDIEVSNEGNVRTQYTFELGSQPSAKGWSARLPRSCSSNRPIPAKATRRGRSRWSSTAHSATRRRRSRSWSTPRRPMTLPRKGTRSPPTS